jgi:hypothetical protein
MAQLTVAVDRVTQDELQLVLDLDNITARACASIRRRLLGGAEAEPGKLKVDADPNLIFDGNVDCSTLYRDGIDIDTTEADEEAAA